MTVTINKKSGLLYHQYSGQSEPQPVYVSLDCRDGGSVDIDWDGEVGNGVSSDVWHGHTQRWPVYVYDGGAISEIVEEMRPQLERVVAGYTTQWDGNNCVAKFTDDATEAYKNIQAGLDQLEEYDNTEVYQADDYLQYAISRHIIEGYIEIDGVGKITAETTDDELDAMVEPAVAHTDHNVHVVGALEYLTDLRSEIQDNS